MKVEGRLLGLDEIAGGTMFYLVKRPDGGRKTVTLPEDFDRGIGDLLLYEGGKYLEHGAPCPDCDTETFPADEGCEICPHCGEKYDFMKSEDSIKRAQHEASTIRRN